MAISPLDQNILWVKAAGRCSMPECRKKLILKGSSHVPSEHVVIGENCHIVANSTDGPRGKSILTEAERDRYPNLILLCRNHHKVIDKDPLAWPIEKLHQIKADHELWVETKFTDSNDSIPGKIYSDLINTATEKLMLQYWSWFTDHAVRSLLSEEFVDGVDHFCVMVKKTIWPHKIKELEKAIINLCDRASLYVSTFTNKAILRDGPQPNEGFYIEDKSWKRVWRRDYDLYVAASKEWENKCTSLLFNLVVALNEYADTVRQTFKPNYFVYQGKFIINDSLGVMSEMKPTIYFPDKYIDI